MRLIYLVGAPGAGKSTLMAAATAHWEEAPDKPVPGLWVRWLSNGPDIEAVEIGRKRDAFSGTDGLGMSVMPVACQFLADCREVELILGEGDRLASMKFLDAAAKAGRREVMLVVLDTPADVAAARREARGSKQNAAWVQGRVTKVRRLAENAAAAGYHVRTINGAAPFDAQVRILRQLILA